MRIERMKESLLTVITILVLAVVVTASVAVTRRNAGSATVLADGGEGK